MLSPNHLHLPLPQAHHESALPSQRYRMTRELPVKLNPIVPQDVTAHEPAPIGFPAGFLELNAPRQRPPLLGNPIFGYSTHPMPPPVLGEDVPQRSPQPGSKASAKAMAKLTELQSMLQEERKLRKELEAELERARR